MEFFWRFCLCPGSNLGIKQTSVRNRGCPSLTADRTAADGVENTWTFSTTYSTILGVSSFPWDSAAAVAFRNGFLTCKRCQRWWPFARRSFIGNTELWWFFIVGQNKLINRRLRGGDLRRHGALIRFHYNAWQYKVACNETGPAILSTNLYLVGENTRDPFTDMN